MFCILTRTAGRTSPNTRRPSRDSNNSLGCYCMKKERSDENVSHRVLAGASWKRSPRCCPFWTVAALSHCKVDAERRDQGIEFHREGFHGRLDGHTPCIDRSTAGSGADLSAALAEYRGQDRQGRTEISRRRDSHHRQCRCGRKATGLRPGAVLRLYPESVCRCHLPIRPERAAAIHSLQPGASGDRTGIFSGQAESAASGAEYGARCRPQRSIAARRGCGASQAVWRSAKKKSPASIPPAKCSRNGKPFRGPLPP